MTEMKAYKATIEVLFTATGDMEAELLLGHMRLGATGAVAPANTPETISSEVRSMKSVPKGTRAHDLLDKIKAQADA